MKSKMKILDVFNVGLKLILKTIEKKKKLRGPQVII